MTVEDITNRLNQYYLWLSSRQWEELALLLAAIAALVIFLIVLVLRSRRKVLPSSTQLREIIGIKLADHNKTSGRTDHIEKNRSSHVPKNPGRRKRRKNRKKGFKMAIVQLNQRREELIKSRQSELLGQQEAVRLAAVNEQVQYEVTESRRAEELPEQKVAEIAAVIEQFRHEIIDSSQDEEQSILKVYEIVPDDEPFQLKVTDSSRAAQHPIQKASEIAAVNEKFKYEKPEPEQPEKVPEESPEQDLKSKKQPQPFDIAEFSKAAISRRQRERSGIYNEYSELDED